MQAWCKFWRLELPKMLQTCHLLSFCNNFDFQIVLARRRGAKFGNFNFQKCSDHAIFYHFATILTSKSFSRAGVVPILATPVFDDFDFQIVLARRRGANFGDFNFQKCPRARQFLTILTSKFWRLQLPKVPPSPSVFNDFDFQIVLARRRGANFGDFNFQKCPRARQFLTILTFKLLSRAGVQILPHLQQPILRARPFLGADFPSQRSHKTMEKQ